MKASPNFKSELVAKVRDRVMGDPIAARDGFHAVHPILSDGAFGAAHCVGSDQDGVERVPGVEQNDLPLQGFAGRRFIFEHALMLAELVKLPPSGEYRRNDLEHSVGRRWYPRIVAHDCYCYQRRGRFLHRAILSKCPEAGKINRCERGKRGFEPRFAFPKQPRPKSHDLILRAVNAQAYHGRVVRAAARIGSTLTAEALDAAHDATPPQTEEDAA